MSYRGRVIALCLMIASVASAQSPRPTSVPTNQLIPRDLLDQIDHAELGKLYTPAIATKLYRAHELLEKYFSDSSARKDVVRDLESLSIDPNIIGRLARIRMNWPQLAGGVYYINEKIGPHDARYYLGVPKGYDRKKPWPLVIKLPTADAFVTDPRPDPIQANDIYTAWTTDELKRHPDALVIMPLLNLDELWGPSYAGMNNVIQPMLHAAGRVNIDPARVYLVGHAMSANAAWNLSLHYTTFFASFNALAGGAPQDWQRLRLMNLRNVLPVIWHDADDDVLNVGEARQLVGGLRTQRINVEYNETRTIGHTPTDEVAEQGYQKMRARVRPLYPKQVSIQSNRPDTMFNRIDWVQVYQPMTEGDEKKIFFARVPGHMTVLPSPFMVNATIDRNTITINTRNVETLQFHVNDQMIDFSRAVSVVQGRRALYEAIVKPDIDQMLKDQLFLGRGWRYYTAVIDIDLLPTSEARRGASATRAHPATSPDDEVP